MKFSYLYMLQKLTRLMFTYLSIMIMLLLSHTINMAYAKQRVFNRIIEQDTVLFNYQWQDHQQQKQKLQLTITKKALFDRFRNFKALNEKSLHQYLNQHLAKQLIQPIQTMQTSAAQPNSSATKREKNKIKKDSNKALSRQAILQQYLHQHFYHQFTFFDGVKKIKPDHTRIAEQSIIALQALTTELTTKTANLNKREKLNYLLSFVQSIPYSTITNRASSSGAGFNPPAKVLWENQGDCDSKMTLLAALIKAIMPENNVVLVYLNNHALLGIDDDKQAQDFAINYQGNTYVIAEVSGPALLNLGKITQTSSIAISNNYYSIEKLP